VLEAGPNPALPSGPIADVQRGPSSKMSYSPAVAGYTGRVLPRNLACSAQLIAFLESRRSYQIGVGLGGLAGRTSTGSAHGKKQYDDKSAPPSGKARPGSTTDRRHTADPGMAASACVDRSIDRLRIP